MNVVYLMGGGDHDHDYGLAGLFDGLVEVLGYDAVHDLPENPTMHLSSYAARDHCGLDSDRCYESRLSTSYYGNYWQLRERLTGAPSDTIIVLGKPDAESRQVIEASDKANGKRFPIIAVDYSDQVADRRAEYEQCAGRPLAAYFKRELPIGADWGYPLPLSYPASRVGTLDFEAKNGLAYYATTHGGGAPGKPRIAIAEALGAMWHGSELIGPGIHLTAGQEKGTRLSPEELHERMRVALVGISWNGAVNVDCNRTWENFAFGLAQVAEYPRIQIPNVPEHGKHCLYAKSPDEVPGYVSVLLDNTAYAREMAKAGHEHFLKWHCSRARAEYLLDIVSKVA